MYRFQVSFFKKKTASILILSLWTLCLLSTFSVYLGYNIRQKLTLIKRIEQKQQLRFLSEAGIKYALAQIKKYPFKSYYCLNDTLNNNPSLFKEISLKTGVFSVSYQYESGTEGLLRTYWGLVDEERKININKADFSVMKRFFRIIAGLSESEAEELSASIIDWRDPDKELTLPLNDAEDPYYLSLKYPYEAKDAEFEVLPELLLVKGFTEELLEKIKPYITIYGNGRININTASKAVLLALGLSADLVERIIYFRAGKDNLEGTEDDNVFESEAEILSILSQIYNLSSGELREVNQIVQRYLTTKSNTFLIKSSSHLINKKNVTEEIEVVVEANSGRILFWQEF
ncbi:MAG: general secretion pathway protein GspK [Candidatus Omnitrophica bacterium]|nr:general secretion pathway protein GspK [Candidatus Omnitrophota bacterium]